MRVVSIRMHATPAAASPSAAIRASIAGSAQCTSSMVKSRGRSRQAASEESSEQALDGPDPCQSWHGVVEPSRLRFQAAGPRRSVRAACSDARPARGKSFGQAARARRFIGADRQVEKGRNQHAGRIAFAPPAEIEQRGLRRGEAALSADLLRRLDQPALADARLAAQNEDLAVTAVAAGIENAGDLSPVPLPSDQWRSAGRRELSRSWRMRQVGTGASNPATSMAPTGSQSKRSARARAAGPESRVSPGLASSHRRAARFTEGPVTV